MKRTNTITLEQAALLVMGFNKDDTFKQIRIDIIADETKLSESAITNSEEITKLNIVRENFNEALRTYETLVNDANLGAKSKNCHLQVAIKRGYSDHFDEKFYPDITKSGFTKDNLAQWFHDEEDIEKANILVPNFIPQTQDKNIIIFELREQNKKLLADNAKLEKQLSEISSDINNSFNNYPSGIQNAINTYEECWGHLTYDMQRPRKENLIGFIKTKLKLTEKISIESVIRLSRPDNEPDGGKHKKEQIKPWKPKT